MCSLNYLPVQAVTFEDIKREVSRDQEMQDLVAAISSKECQDRFPDSVSHYNKFSENLSVMDGVPMFGRRVIVPASLSQSVLISLHSAHHSAVSRCRTEPNTLCSGRASRATLRGSGETAPSVRETPPRSQQCLHSHWPVPSTLPDDCGRLL